MIEQMKSLLQRKDLCVLATATGGVPHCSLMSYVVNEDCTALYMATLRDTTKFANLSENPRVSLLVDTRDDGASGEKSVPFQALTVAGRCEALGKTEERTHARAALLDRHPSLQEVLEHPDTEFLRVAIESFLLLDGPRKSHFERV
jgi:nitroimidazol reductase NimA-like FMN-containing flavoprotein (pyridoxamine 5'-phosphate oxidase superfamily)